MPEQEFKRAFAHATTALNLLKRSVIPPYPQFYELLYTYATGVNPALNARINAILRQGDASEDVAKRLYNEFIRAEDANERITSVSQRMSQRIEAVHDAIDTAMTTANAYSGALQTASGDLDGDMDAANIRAMAQRLLGETRHMQDANFQLEQKLEASRSDIAALQHDLDDVRREAMLDPLTKIYNRKAFDDGLFDAIETTNKDSGSLCLMLVDIDHFKRFNDTWGHQTGDQVLRLVAMTLKSSIRPDDVAARYGGEEFAAILPGARLKDAVGVAQSIRKAIQSKELLKRSTIEKLGRITASFGVAEYRVGDTTSTLIERADRCLYAAKHAGRNCVVSQAELKSDDVVAA